MQSPFKHRNSKCCSVSSLIFIISRIIKRLAKAYAHAGLSLCSSHKSHCWKFHVMALTEMNIMVGFEPSQNGFSASLPTELSMLSKNGFHNSQT